MLGSGRKMDILDWAIVPLVFLYILTAYLISAIPVVARVNPAIGALLVVLTFARIAANGVRPNWRYWMLPVFFTLFSFASVAWSPDPGNAVFVTLRSSAALMGGVAIWVALDYGMPWKVVVWAVVTGAVGVVLSSVGLAASGGLSTRLAGLSGNANVMAVSLGYAAFVVWCAPVKLPRWLHTLAAGLVVYAFFFSGSRKVVLVLAGILLLLVIKAPRNMRRLSVRIGLVLLLFAVPAVWIVLAAGGVDVASLIGKTQVVERLADLSAANTGGRLELAESALGLWQERPLTGWGIGQFAVASGVGTYSHTNFTELLVDLGLVGFALYYALPLALLARTVQGLARRSSPHQSAFALLLLILALDPFMVSFSERTFGVFLGFTAALATMPMRGLARSVVPSERTRLIRARRAWT